jgi:lipoate-protein ligase B
MIIDLGLSDYEYAYALQRELVDRRLAGRVGDSLIMTEHRDVYTLGRGASRSNILEDEEALMSQRIKVIRVDRGGDITYHGPGQIVAYPVIDLKERGRDLHRYMRDLESAAIELCAFYGVKGRRVAGKTGVWAGGSKIASIGVAARSWVTYHGIAVNIDADMEKFKKINPCGMRDVRMASLAEMVGSRIDTAEAGAVLAGAMAEIFGFGFIGRIRSPVQAGALAEST